MRGRRRTLRWAMLALALIVVAGSLATVQDSPQPEGAAASNQALSQEVIDANYLNCFDLPEISPELPGAPLLEDGQQMDQNVVNCFAWQEFIALNWTVSDGQCRSAGHSVSGKPRLASLATLDRVSGRPTRRRTRSSCRMRSARALGF